MHVPWVQVHSPGAGKSMTSTHLRSGDRSPDGGGEGGEESMVPQYPLMAHPVVYATAVTLFKTQGGRVLIFRMIPGRYYHNLQRVSCLSLHPKFTMCEESTRSQSV